ncbi:hypothetical protein B0T25DRAFT_574730 [Lasiosphaeria hispida]|uniref:Uncharacterized protein n=1 Tax=Lasiosphaeria hispida TaxID=260671 RepID=A0AAJ0H591_9PEZI|nr:hypothetical protein B0T25DRAFT_574730 [Lasiosphaeria hispida]
MRALHRHILESLPTKRHRSRLRKSHGAARIHNTHPELGDLCNAADQAVQEYQTSLNDLSARIQKYVAHFREGGSGNAVKDVGMKLRWHIREKDAIVKFRNSIATHTSALNILLASVTRTTIREIIQSFGTLQTTCIEIRDSILKLLHSNNNILKALREIQSGLPSTLERNLIQEPFILEDAIGRIAPVPLQFIDS